MKKVVYILILLLSRQLNSQAPFLFEYFREETARSHPQNIIYTAEGIVFTESSLALTSVPRTDVFLLKWDHTIENLFDFNYYDASFDFRYIKNKVSLDVYQGHHDCTDIPNEDNHCFFDILDEKKVLGDSRLLHYSYMVASINDTSITILSNYINGDLSFIFRDKNGQFEPIGDIFGYGLIDNDEHFYGMKGDSIYLFNSDFIAHFYKPFQRVDWIGKNRIGFTALRNNNTLIQLDKDFNELSLVTIPDSLKTYTIPEYVDGNYLINTNKKLYILNTNGGVKQVWSPANSNMHACLIDSNKYAVSYSRLNELENNAIHHIVVNTFDNTPVSNYPSMQVDEVVMGELHPTTNYLASLPYEMTFTNDGTIQIDSLHIVALMYSSANVGGIVWCPFDAVIRTIKGPFPLGEKITISDTISNIWFGIDKTVFYLSGANHLPLVEDYIQSFDLIISASNEVASNNISCTPNPVSDLLTIYNVEQDANYSIIDVSGRCNKKGRLDNNTLDMSSFPAGIYFLTMIHKDGTITQTKLAKM